MISDTICIAVDNFWLRKTKKIRLNTALKARIFQVLKIGTWLSSVESRESRGGVERSSRLKRDRSDNSFLKVMKSFTYILFSESQHRYYTGSSDDLKQRIERHNESKVQSTKFGVPWNLKRFCEHSTRSEARKLELKIKKRGAKRFLEEINKES